MSDSGDCVAEHDPEAGRGQVGAASSGPAETRERARSREDRSPRQQHRPPIDHCRLG